MFGEIMDAKSEYTLTTEQRSIMNAGRGPPFKPPGAQDVYNNKGSMSASSKENLYYPNSASADPHVYDNSPCMMIMTPQGMVGPCLMIPRVHLETNMTHIDRQTPQGKYEQIQRSSHQPKNVQGSINQTDTLRKLNDDLHRDLVRKSKEVEELKLKLRQLTERLNDLPDIPSENYAEDRFINLATTNEMASGGFWTEKRAEDGEDMMKSIQCSELSMEQPHENEYNEEGKGRSADLHQVLQTTEKGVSSASSTSFEVVDKEFCADPKTYFEEGELKKLENERCANLEQIKNLEVEIQFLMSQFKMLEERLDAEQSQRIEAEAQISKRLDELSTNDHQGTRSRSAENAVFLQQERFFSEMQDLKQMVSELTAAKWKLTEQAKELMRENKELKNMVQELRSRETDVQKFQLEEKMRGQLCEIQNQLQAKCQCLLEAETRVRELEHEHKNAENFAMQQGSDETTIALTTENALLKLQLVTCKEDFEIEHRDNEKLASERDTLQHYYDTIRSDLDNARHQLRKYEQDIASLRADNSTMRTKLREVTDKISSPKETKIVPLNATHDFSQISSQSSQLQDIVNSKPSSTLTGQSANWNCKSCTLSNAAHKTFCDVCRTQNDPKPSTSSRTESPASRLPSSFSNYGNIETD